jgi:hypothetical protein
MKNFLVTETERIEILKRHRSLLKEQYQAPTEQQLIEAGLMAACFGNIGQSKNPIEAAAFLQGKMGQSRKSGKYVFEKPSKSRPGFMIRYLPDATYFFYNHKTQETSKIYSLPNGCPAITNYKVQVKPDKESEARISYLKAQTPPYKTLDDLVAANEYSPDIRNSALYDYEKIGNVELFRKKSQQSGGMNDQINPIRTQWTKYLKDQGFEVNPTDTEKEGLISGRLYNTVKNVPQGVFPPDQLVWFDPSKNLDSDKLGDKQETEDIDRGSCKNTIERFYNEFIRTKGRQVTQTANLQKMKDQAQFCKNRWEGQWGIGGGKFEDMIKVLSGRTNRGPSSSGDDSIFRLQ